MLNKVIAHRINPLAQSRLVRGTSSTTAVLSIGGWAGRRLPSITHFCLSVTSHIYALSVMQWKEGMDTACSQSRSGWGLYLCLAMLLHSAGVGSSMMIDVEEGGMGCVVISAQKDQIINGNFEVKYRQCFQSLSMLACVRAEEVVLQCRSSIFYVMFWVLRERCILQARQAKSCSARAVLDLRAVPLLVIVSSKCLGGHSALDICYLCRAMHTTSISATDRHRLCT